RISLSRILTPHQLSSPFLSPPPPPPNLSTLSLHDALPICSAPRAESDGASERTWSTTAHEGDVVTGPAGTTGTLVRADRRHEPVDRKSTRLNSSYSQISYAVFCLKKKKIKKTQNDKRNQYE